MPNTIEVRFDRRAAGPLEMIEPARRDLFESPRERVEREHRLIEMQRRGQSPVEQGRLIMEQVERERRMIEAQRRGAAYESPFEQYERAMRLPAELEAARREMTSGPPRWLYSESLFEQEMRNEFLEQAIRRELIMLLCR